MRVYISGLMTGLPDCNRAAFDAAAKRLAEQGFFPDWMAHRLATFKAEATSLADALKEHQQEHEEDNR